MQASTSVGVAQPGMTGAYAHVRHLYLNTANGFLRRVCAERHLRRGQPALFQRQRQRHCFFRIVDLNNGDDPDRF